MGFPRLDVFDGPDSGHSFTIAEDGSKMLGRQENAFYRLSDPHVSRLHCEVRRLGTTVTVIDNHGSGGLLVNGRKVPRAALRHRDIVQVGDTRMRFLAYGDSAETMAAPQHETPAAEPDDPLAALVGETFNHFEIGNVVGRGANSIVFRARDINNNKALAMKVMPPEFIADRAELKRFTDVMTIALALSHPNLVMLYGAGKSGSLCWLAMEYVDGESLGPIIGRIGHATVPDWKFALQVTFDVARALHELHTNHLIHRRVTPNNIRIRAKDKHAVLCDPMGAIVRDPVAAKHALPSTHSGGDHTDEHGDLYDLGAVAYALLTGKPPAAHFSSLTADAQANEAASLSVLNPEIPPEFPGIVFRLLSKRPGDRIPNAGVLVDELRQIAKHHGLRIG